MEDPMKNDAADSELQFDQAEFGDPDAGLQCTSCSKPIVDTYHEINGHVVCESCHQQTMALRTGGSGLARFVRAAVFGAVAAAVGAGIYYGILALTGYENRLDRDLGGLHGRVCGERRFAGPGWLEL